jgi:hypothetical protein
MTDPGSKGVIKTKDHANRQLRFGIAIGQGHICKSSAKGRLQIMLIIKERLEESGWVWQAKILNSWIHRLQPKRADLSEREREEASLEAGILPYAKSIFSKEEDF